MENMSTVEKSSIKIVLFTFGISSKFYSNSGEPEKKKISVASRVKSRDNVLLFWGDFGDYIASLHLSSGPVCLDDFSYIVM